MNEFIVWDKENYIGNDDRFYTPSDLSLDGLYLQIIDDGKLILTDMVDDGEYSVPKQIQIETFSYTGKTDIDGNKIYADSSIVEFDFETEEKIVGYFTYNKEWLRFDFVAPLERCCVKPKADMAYIPSYFKNLKIIGTLQENKELLCTH